MAVSKFLRFLWVGLLLLVQPYSAFGSTRLASDSSIVLNPPPLGICASAVTKYGYKCQEIDVTTEDGYILSVQRIPSGIHGGGGSGGRRRNRPPVLLQHGVLVDGMAWLLNSPEQSLALILADNGFDEFWNWTWDEIVASDLPAVITYIFQQTGQKIHYVGHSLGTLIALASFSEGKEIEKMKSGAMLSPIAHLSHMTTTLGVVAAKVFAGEITIVFGLAEFNPKGEDVGRFLKALCADPKVDCYDLMSAITGKNCCLNSSTMDVFLRSEPQSTSTKNLVHMAQTVRDRVLAKYDYGNPVFNLEHYGIPRPPIYNLSNIPKDFPLFMSHGGQDALSDLKDVANLLDDLKLHDEGKLSVQYVKEYAHADFIMGVTAKDVVYDKIISQFNDCIVLTNMKLSKAFMQSKNDGRSLLHSWARVISFKKMIFVSPCVKAIGHDNVSSKKSSGTLNNLQGFHMHKRIQNNMTIGVWFKSALLAGRVVHVTSRRFHVCLPQNHPWWKALDTNKTDASE
ncbi:hypothetical protein L1987_46657 [Smallanthus sonchifolius]|uniref:Uncharacterized protein n=1 Tax=Smallanthus sonchifolius TaxID=185202 RepID=A0ACB9G073_9ASTR|nr:hypothetical protein L1987_46657 [Smallanthus sonchifolius]